MSEIYTVSVKENFPDLEEIIDPPENLYVRGNLPVQGNFLLNIVGSRKYSEYGKSALKYLIEGLRGYPITIVSGLAIGIDSLAHKFALDNSLQTIAVPGSSLENDYLYPRLNFNLAESIITSGGGLVSEFPPQTKAAPWTFPKRNRIMAGISKATLIIEAEEKSGTLITARLASDFNRDLLVVPGSIFSPQSQGVNQFLKLGASPTTKPEDILDVFGLETSSKNDVGRIDGLSNIEKEIYDLLIHEPLTRDEVVEKLSHEASVVNQNLTLLEIRGVLYESMGKFNIYP